MPETTFQIVIAEDNSADVMLVRQALKEHRIDCTIHVLSDGEQALRFLGRADSELDDKRFDLMLLDLNLPKYDGQEVLKKLRSTRHYAETPVIIMTAMDAAAPEMKCATEIAPVCFPKPSNLDEFLNLGGIVRELLEKKRAHTQPMKPSRDVEGLE